MKKHVMAIYFLFSAPCLADDVGAFQFKGLHPGQSYSEIQTDPRLICKEKKTVAADYYCMLNLGQKETIAGANVKNILVTIMNEKAVAIAVMIDTKDYDQIKLAITEKHGPGQTEDSIIENRMGAKFDNQKITWRKHDAVMTLTKRVGKIDDGQLFIISTSPEFVQESKKRKVQNTSINANDL